jgi:hypothetical protein
LRRGRRPDKKNVILLRTKDDLLLCRMRATNRIELGA